MRYRVEITRPARKALRRIPSADRARLVVAIDALIANPRPRGCLNVKGAPDGTYRIRVGLYRVVYVIQDADLVIVVVRVARRNEHTYRGL